MLTTDCPVGVARLRRRVMVAITTSLALVVAAFMARPMPHARGGAMASVGQRVRAAAVDTEAWLRASEFFGPVVEWLDPAPVMMLGDIGSSKA